MRSSVGRPVDFSRIGPCGGFPHVPGHDGANVRFLCRFALFVALAVAVWGAGGCAHERFVTDANHPEIEILSDGAVTYRGRVVQPAELPKLLVASGFTREDTINVRVPSRDADMVAAGRTLAALARGGFPRSVLVKERRSYSEVRKKRK